MNLFKSMRRAIAPTLVAIGAISGNAMATEYDLSVSGNTSANVPGDVGGTAIFRDYFTQPAGTGVFDPFLTIERNAAGKPPTSNSNIEQGYNTDGVLYMDQQRPNWNKLLHVGDLAPITVSGKTYYGFELDANEPGADKSIISVDNIRVYTSSGDNTGAVKDNLANLASLGTLRWALNDGVKNADGSWNVTDWVKLDAAQENVDSNSNGGSGKSDMLVLIPTTAFTGASANDFVWFYNLNGVHYTVDGDLAAESGYEEWRAVVKLNTVPDGGATVALLGLGIIGLGAMRRKLN
jgi:hypothetical protein